MAHSDTSQAPHSVGLGHTPTQHSNQGGHYCSTATKINILGVVLVCTNWKYLHKTVSSLDTCDHHAPYMHYALQGEITTLNFPSIVMVTDHRHIVY